MKKIHVSYLVVIVYVTVVLLVSLLIALLASLAGVKRGNCDNNAVKLVDELRNQIEIDVHRLNKNLPKIKRDAAENIAYKTYLDSPKAKKDVETRQRLREKALNNDFIKSKLAGMPMRANDDCPEFLVFQNGTLWESIRLPEYVRAVKYDLELYIPTFKEETYAGVNQIKIELDRDTNVILFHSTAVDIVDGQIFDNQNRTIEIKCGGYYPLNDYYAIITKTPILKSQSPLTLSTVFVGQLSQSEVGLFDIPYEGGSSSNLLTSHFQPLDARKAFPCFDEPSFKSVFSIRIDHPVDTIAVSNMPPDRDEPIQGINNTIRTIFKDTPKLPTYLLAITVFDKNDFKGVTAKTSSGKTISVWARNKFVDAGFASDPLAMAVNIFNAIEYYLYPLGGLANSGPEVINMIALPDYRSDAIAHWGIPLFQETKLLFKDSTVTELVKQRIALLIAKTFTEFWAGNAVTFKWWDELWLQEGLSDYLKYKFVDFAYQDWRINEQFITEELINVLVNDAYPSSHPVVKPIYFFYDIEQLFDDVETAKVAAILRMIEYEIGTDFMWNAIGDYFTQFVGGVGDPNFLFDKFGNIRNWPAKDFVDRWFLQSNYPSLSVSVRYDSVQRKQYLHVIQDRNLNSPESIFGLDELYPSPFNYTWYVPLKCALGESVNDKELNFFTFDVDKRESDFPLDKNYTWIHCDEFFTGYYMLDYTEENWNQLANVLKQKDNPFNPEDRANIIHNAFVNAFAEKERYYDLVNVLGYLRQETDFIPWRTVGKHVSDLVDILEYRPSFYAVSNFFNFELRVIEQNFNLWTATNNHVEEIAKTTILELACRLQDFDCLKNSSSYWSDVQFSIGNPGTANPVPIHVRPVVYNYHFQNTYSIRDWDFTFLQYVTTEDSQEEERLLEALTYTRLPSQLARFLESQRTGGLRSIDFVDAVKYFAKNPLGRELVWNYYRANYDALIDEYSLDSPILGTLLLEIVRTFEDEYLFFELIKFIIYTPSGASINARFKALELVSTTVVWLIDKETEIEQAFSPRGFTRPNTDSKVQLSEFKAKVNEFLSQSKEFQQFRNQLLSHKK